MKKSAAVWDGKLYSIDVLQEEKEFLASVLEPISLFPEIRGRVDQSREEWNIFVKNSETFTLLMKDLPTEDQPSTYKPKQEGIKGDTPCALYWSRSQLEGSSWVRDPQYAGLRQYNLGTVQK